MLNSQKVALQGPRKYRKGVTDIPLTSTISPGTRSAAGTIEKQPNSFWNAEYLEK